MKTATARRPWIKVAIEYPEWVGRSARCAGVFRYVMRRTRGGDLREGVVSGVLDSRMVNEVSGGNQTVDTGLAL